MIAEIEFNRHAQEELALTQPDHPARLCGEAVEQRTNGQMIASDPDAAKNSRLQALASAWTLAQAIGSSSKDRLRAQAQFAIDEILLPIGDTREQYVDTETILRERASLKIKSLGYVANSGRTSNSYRKKRISLVKAVSKISD